MPEDFLKIDNINNKDIEREYQAGSERLKLALEISKTAVWDWNFRTDEIYNTSWFLNKLGYQENEIPISPESWFSIIHPDDLNSIKTFFEESRQGTRESYEIEYRIRSKSGEWHWILSTGKLVERDKAGRPLRMIGTHTDITEKKNFKIKLLESREKYSSAFQMSPDISVITTHPEGVCIDVNDAFLNTLGYTREEIIGKKSSDVEIWDKQQQREEIVQLIRQNGYCKDIETSARKKNGDIIYGLFSARLVNLNTGSVVFGTFKDTTERKHAIDFLRLQKDLSIALAGATELGELGNHVLNAVVKLEGIDCGGLYIRDINTGELSLIAHQGVSDSFVKSASRFIPDASEASIVEKGEPVYMLYSESDFPRNKAGIDEGFKLLFINPVKYDNNIIANLIIASHTHYELSQGVRDCLEAVAGMLGNSIARIHNEETIREINARLKALIESPLDICIFSLDTKYRYTSFNQKQRNKILAQYDIEIKIGMNSLDIIPVPEIKTDLKQNYDRVLNGESVIRKYETAGRIYYLTISPIFGESHNVIGISCFSQDITGQKKIEEALLESKKKFETIIESSAEGILIANTETRRFTYANPEICSMFGYTSEELLDKSVDNIHPEESLAHTITQFTALGRGEIKMAPSIPCLRKDGTKFFADVRASRMTAEGILYTVGFFTDITERKQAEEALHESLMLFETQFRSSPDIILIIDQDLKIININRILAGNFTTDGLKGADAIEILPPGSRNLARQKLECCFAAGEPQEFEHSIGDGKWVSARVIRLARTGKPHQAMIIATDITERRQALEILHIQKDMSIAIAGATELKELGYIMLNAVTKLEGIDSGGLYMRDTETGKLTLIAHKGLPDTFIQSSSCFAPDSPQARIVSKGEPVYISYSKLDVPKDDARLSEGLKLLFVIPIKHENKIVANLNLASHTHNEVPSAIRDSIEAIEGMLGGAIARVRNETAIREINARINSIMESPNDICIYSLDTDYKVTSFNEPFKRMLLSKYNTEIKNGMNILDIIGPPSQRMEARQDYVRALNGESFTKTINILDSLYDFTVSPIFENYKKVIGISCFIRDITEQKIMEDKLHQSEKMEAIGQLTGGIAHDFNNELSIISGYSELICAEVKSNPKLINYTDNILKCVNRSTNLISQMLAFSRKGKYLSASVNMHEIISEIITMLKHSIDKRILIHQKLEASPSTTLGDPSQLKSAVLNLALNARDAMPDGGEIIFKTEITDINDEIYKEAPFSINPGKYIAVSVSDTGIGMDNKIQSHLFEPFFTTKAKGKGTGFGLASVYGTIRNHNGMINVYSEPGHGSTFKVYLPLAPDLSVAKAKKTRPVKTAKISANILVVEDEEALRDIAEETLINLGCKVSLCKDGREGTDFYKKNWHEIDIVILDMVMPVMNGMDAFIAMQKINPDIKALVTSGYSLNGDAQAILEKGAKGFLQKPFRKNELLQKIKEIMDTGIKSAPPGKSKKKKPAK